MPSQSLVDRVIDNLVHQMMESTRPCGADVHPRALTDWLKPFEDLNLFSAVGGLNL